MSSTSDKYHFHEGMTSKDREAMLIAKTKRRLTKLAPLTVELIAWGHRGEFHRRLAGGALKLKTGKF